MTRVLRNRVARASALFALVALTPACSSPERDFADGEEIELAVAQAERQSNLAQEKQLPERENARK
jgi:hypothetical protein